MSIVDHKGISWVGNIYQKFEAMCLEVEEAMYQDTAKYVENQVQTVGASVKKFYSEVMQDLVPPPEGAVKVDDADLSLDAYADVRSHMKPKAKSVKANTMQFSEDFNGIAGVEVNNELSFKGTKKDGGIYRRSNACIKRISRKANYSMSSEKSSPNTTLSKDPSEASLNSGIQNNHELVHEKIIMSESQKSGINLSTDSNGKKGRTMSCVSSGDGLQGESTDTGKDSGLVSQIGSYTCADTQDNQSSFEEVLTSRAGNSGDCGENAIENTDAAISKTRMMIEQDDKSKLEDSCVWVDGEKLCFVPQTEGKHRSYKKKIRKAFSSKIRPTRKQEYEQLAVQYAKINKGSNSGNGESLALTFDADMHTNKLSTYDPCEPEWELL